MVGLEVASVKLFGPVHANADPGVDVTLSVKVFPAHMGLFDVITGTEGV